MHKKFIPKLFLMIFTFCVSLLPANADIMPYYVNNINPNTIGVYQANNQIKVYKEPNLNSALLLTANWSDKVYSCPEVSASNLFVAFYPKKDLAFLSVVDENEDGTWVQILYNQNGLKKGWVYKDDEFKFMNWRTFFNIYGRKYGLYYLKDAPEETKIIYGSTVEDAKSIGIITQPQTLKLQGVSGNWFLVIALDIDKAQKIGWIKWRNISGDIFLFPAIK